MNWKSLPYWAKGVICVLGVLLVLIILEGFIVMSIGTVGPFAFFILLPAILLSTLLGSETFVALQRIPVLFPFVIIFWIVVGAVIGWAYGKIKTRSATTPVLKQ